MIWLLFVGILLDQSCPAILPSLPAVFNSVLPGPVSVPHQEHINQSQMQKVHCDLAVYNSYSYCLLQRRPVFFYFPLIARCRWFHFYGNLYKLSEPFFFFLFVATTNDIYCEFFIFFNELERTLSSHSVVCPIFSPSAVSWNLNFLSLLRAALSRKSCLGFTF